MKLPDESLKPAGLAFWFGLLLCVLILIGSFYNLANYPTIWWDEAIFSEAAANLVQHGRYAFTVQSPNQLSDLDFRISAGPAVILPVALAYKLFGVSLLSGRLVAGAYLVLAFLALFLGARRLWGPVTALLAVALAFLGTDVFYWGRSVLGDIPALGLFLCATCFLIRGLESRALWPLFWGGIFLGLAFNAKEFYGLACLPPLVLLAQQHWRDKRRLSAQRPGLRRRCGPPASGLPGAQGGDFGEPDRGHPPFPGTETTPVPRVLHTLHHRPHLPGESPVPVAESPFLAGMSGGRLDMEERDPISRG